MTCQVVAVLCLLSLVTVCPAAEHFVAPDGKSDAAGTSESPWDVVSALEGRQPVKPGDTVWLRQGTYRCESAYETGGQGYAVTLSGSAEKPIAIKIKMSNSSGIFQIDNLLKPKLKDSGLEEHIQISLEITGTEKKILEKLEL